MTKLTRRDILYGRKKDLPETYGKNVDKNSCAFKK